MMTINNFAAATTYTAEVLENPTYNTEKGAAFFKARINGKEVGMLAMRGGVLNNFLQRADGMVPEKATGGYDFRGLKVTGRGTIGISQNGLNRFLNLGYVTRVEAKAEPAAKAVAEPAAKAEVTPNEEPKPVEGKVYVKGYYRSTAAKK